MGYPRTRPSGPRRPATIYLLGLTKGPGPTFLLMVSRYVPFSPSAHHLTSRNLNDFNASYLGCSARRTDLEKAFDVRTPTRPANGNS
jgi:hypothetical protein